MNYLRNSNCFQEEQELWATDLNLHYNDSTAMNSLVTFMSNGSFDAKEHIYNITPPKQERKRRRRRHQSEDDEVSSCHYGYDCHCNFVYSFYLFKRNIETLAMTAALILMFSETVIIVVGD